MSTCQEVIAQSFPTIDTEITNYVNGVLEQSAEDLVTPEDLYDAVGPVLQESDGGEKTDDDIKEICRRLFLLLKGKGNGLDVIESTEKSKVLHAPVYLGSLANGMAGEAENSSSIWLSKRESGSQENQRKLVQLDAKQQKKQEKRNQGSATKKSENALCEELATASQQFNRRDAKLEASGTNRSYDVKIENFDVAYGERVLITGASVQLAYGRRYGFVGRNGLGKTTLLRMLARRDLFIPSHISILHVEQEVVGDETVALDSVLESDVKRTALLREEKQITAKLVSSSPDGVDNSLNNRLNDIYHELELMEADKAPAKAAMILNGLGFNPVMQKQFTKEFSGGWRMRLALARALFSKPDLLLLDEPTNMLDMKAIIWLENYLQGWESTIVCVSHDRQFLNAIATDILHLHSQIIDVYRGNYEIFHKTRVEKLKNQQREYEAQKQYRDHIQVFIDRFRYNANRASQVQSKLKMLEKLPELKPVEKESDVILKFPECDRLSPPILQLDEMDFYYSKDKVIFKNICVNTAMDSRICIVGQNGAGKTTLLKILLGNLEPVRGFRHVHRNLKIGYFSQHHVDQLIMNLSSVEFLAEKFPGQSSEAYRGKLGAYGLSGDIVMRPISSLSGGQKSRLAFAVMSMTNPNFFILDEPTNHLDMETIEALGNALFKFQGGVVLVSHDERLIRKICNELWVVEDKTVKSLEGGFDEYKKIVEKELESQS